MQRLVAWARVLEPRRLCAGKFHEVAASLQRPAARRLAALWPRRSSGCSASRDPGAQRRWHWRADGGQRRHASDSIHPTRHGTTLTTVPVWSSAHQAPLPIKARSTLPQRAARLEPARAHRAAIWAVSSDLGRRAAVPSSTAKSAHSPVPPWTRRPPGDRLMRFWSRILSVALR